MPIPLLQLGESRPLARRSVGTPFRLPTHHLVTHCVITGMTGSGKTGLVMVMIEEALRAGVPVLAFDVKGDLANLLLSFPDFEPATLRPWIDGVMAATEERSIDEVARELAQERRRKLEAWDLRATELADYHARTEVRVVTPGSTAGEPLHVLSSLERRSSLWDSDRESARAALAAAVSLVLRLVGREADPAKSREHVLLSVLAERRLLAGGSADLGSLIDDLADPPIDGIGALSVDDYVSRHDRKGLAAALNTLLASPSFAGWREGSSLDVGAWLTPGGVRTPATLVSVAHLDDDERMLVLGMVLEELLAWVRSQPGTQRLRALVVFDEIYGFLPPHPHAPPTKRPLVALMKQARAFGVGMVVATQNPMDLDYRVLSNAGLWCVGRLQTDADRARVVEGLAGAGAANGGSSSDLSALLKRLGPRWFLVRDTHASESLSMLQPRQTLSWLRGPLTRSELARAYALRPMRT